MIDAKDLEFDINNEEILFYGVQKPGQAISQTVQDEDSVSLKKGEIEIEVRGIRKNPDGSYSGKVQYVEPYQSLSGVGVTVGVEICFSHNHIYACTH